MTKQKSTIVLRDIIDSDLPRFFEFQLDPDANYMAAFTAEDPTDRAKFDDHWSQVLKRTDVLNKTILYEDKVAGYIVKFDDFGEPEIGYWIGKAYWGKGIATGALSIFIDQIGERPLFARAVKDNAGSIRVLEKCGFKIVKEDKGYANARHAEVEEYILKLE